MFGAYVRLFPSQLWRLVTPIFVHIGWEHFFFNMLTLYFVGQLAEQIWGHHKFLALYVLSGIVGNIFTLFFTPNVIAAGASTSLFGVFAAIMVAGYFGRNPYLKELGRNYQALIIVNLILIYLLQVLGLLVILVVLSGVSYVPSFYQRLWRKVCLNHGNVGWRQRLTLA